MEPLISVIVPIFNVEKYLKKCVDSIITQTYKNLEIILVDDGSPDNCGVICDEYEKKDSRIRVIHKENRGPAEARNVGIDICKGEYISFVDSDDFVSERYIEILYESIIRNEADISFTSSGIIFNDNSKSEKSVRFDDRNYTINEISTFKMLELILYQRVPCGMVRRLYKRKILEDLRCPSNYLYAEDLSFVYKAIIKAEKIVRTSACIYAVRLTPNSILRSQINENKIKSAIDISRMIYMDICKYDLRLQKAAASRAFSVNYGMFIKIDSYKDKAADKLWNEIKKYRKYVLTDINKKMRQKNRLGAVITYFGEKFTWIVGRIFTSIV